MAFQKITGKRKYYKYAECSPGQVLVEGHFIGLEAGKFGTNLLFRDGDGEITCLNSAGQLLYVFQDPDRVERGQRMNPQPVRPGQYVRVTYSGKEEIKAAHSAFHGKEAHRFEVEVDDERAKSLEDTPTKSPTKSAPVDAPVSDISL